MKPRILGCVFFVGLLAGPAQAWGPHTEITRAALAVLPERGRLQEHFGVDWDRIARDYDGPGEDRALLVKRLSGARASGGRG